MFGTPCSVNVAAALLLAAAGSAPPCAADAPGPSPAASIQDLMIYEVDLAADYLWDVVGTVVTAEGAETHQPSTDDDWEAARREAVILTEAGNLLMIDGRAITAPGRAIADEGVDGVLTTAEAQSAIDGNREDFNAMALALHHTGLRMLRAVEARDAQALLDAGDALDAVCEGCHMRFWYPNQVIPAFPDALSGARR